jgi:hypothetical protein
MSQEITLFYRLNGRESREINSREFAWDLEDPERYKVRPMIFDIQKAKALITAKPRPVVYFNPNHFHVAIESFKIRGLWDHPRKPVDLSIPVIMVPWGAGFPPGFLPIDGWKRIATAIEQDFQPLPAVVLDDQESLAIAWVPPEESFVVTPNGERIQLYGK